MRPLITSQHLPATVTQLSADEYRYADRLPDGEVVVVGADGCGAEIAEELHLAGRQVHLFTQPIRPVVRAQGLAGLPTGGHIDIGALVRRGLRLYGSLLAVHDGRMIAAPGLYLGCRTNELDVADAGVTSVVWNSAAAQRTASAAA